MYWCKKQFNNCCLCDVCQKHQKLGRPKYKRTGSRYNPYFELILDKRYTVVKECGFCKRRDYIAFYTSPIVKEFLEVENLCWNCQDLVNAFVMQKDKLCIFKSPLELIQLALLKMLEHCLRGEIHLQTKKFCVMSNEWTVIRQTKEIEYKPKHHALADETN